MGIQHFFTENMKWIVIGLNVLFSYRGFNDRNFFNAYKFHVGSIIKGKDYQRMITSGFLHADWQHLIFNMLSFYFFCDHIVANLGPYRFIVIYLASLLAGNFISLYVNKTYYQYSAIGASGAVSGIVFAAIAMAPDATFSFMIVPVPLKAWIYGVIYILASIYGMKAQNDNIGHDAHLGGAIAGLFVTLAYMPALFMEHTLAILCMAIPCIVMLVILFFNPGMHIDDIFKRWRR